MPLDLSTAEKETGRLEAFSDGVFAIAITLLVIELKVPHGEELAEFGGLLKALLHDWFAFVAFFLSFTTILIMWVNHHILFTYIKRTDGFFLFLNGFLLLFVTFVPFPTALLAEYAQQPDAKVAAALYTGVYLCIAIIFNLLWRYAATEHRLLAATVDRTAIRRITKQYFFGPPLYLVAFLLAFINVPLSIIFSLLLALFFAFTGSMSRFFD